MSACCTAQVQCVAVDAVTPQLAVAQPCLQHPSTFGGLGAAALCIEKNAQDHNIIQVALQQRGCAAAKRAAERANLQDRHNVGFGNIRVVVQELDAYREHAVLLGSEVCSG